MQFSTYRPPPKKKKIIAKLGGNVSSLGKFHNGKYLKGPDQFHPFISQAFGQI